MCELLLLICEYQIMPRYKLIREANVNDCRQLNNVIQFNSTHVSRQFYVRSVWHNGSCSLFLKFLDSKHIVSTCFLCLRLLCMYVESFDRAEFSVRLTEDCLFYHVVYWTCVLSYILFRFWMTWSSLSVDSMEWPQSSTWNAMMEQPMSGNIYSLKLSFRYQLITPKKIS